MIAPLAVGVILAAVGAVTASLGFRAFRSRVKGSRFDVHEQGEIITLHTELGKYVFDGPAGKVHLERPDGARSFIKLRDVRGVQIRVGYKPAGVEEFFIEGWNITDLDPDYRDHRMHWDVVLNTSHGAVALAHMTQYKKRDWFDLATPLQHAVLGMVGLYRDGADVAARLEHHTLRALRKAGLNVLGGYDEIAPRGALAGAPVPTDDDLPQPARPKAPPQAIELPPPPDNPRWESASGRR